MGGGDFSRGMGRRGIPKLMQRAHFIYSGVGSHTVGGMSIFIFDYERGML